MARKNKSGLDYFPHDTTTSIDDKIQLIEADHGLNGYAVYMKLLEKIYNNSYYLEFKERQLKIFSRQINIPVEECKNILSSLLNEGLFNKKTYEKYKILTAKAIQIRYCEGISRRKMASFVSEYLEIDINVYINNENVDINLINVDKSTQRREEKRREEGKEIKEDINIPLKLKIKKLKAYALKEINLTVTVLNQLESLIDAYGYEKCFEIFDNCKLYWKREKKKRKYRLAKRWNKLFENIEFFLKRESTNDRIAQEVAWERSGKKNSIYAKGFDPKDEKQQEEEYTDKWPHQRKPKAPYSDLEVKEIK